jgi:hypothetical protein
VGISALTRAGLEELRRDFAALAAADGGDAVETAAAPGTEAAVAANPDAAARGFETAAREAGAAGFEPAVCETGAESSAWTLLYADDEEEP